jgi:hypothetical protein
LGDAIILTPLIRQLKEDGYHVTLNVSSYCLPVFENNPFVDNILENLWRSVAIGTEVHVDEWSRLEAHSRQWSPIHAEQLAAVNQMYTVLATALEQHGALVAEYQQRAAAGPRTQEELDMLNQIAAAAKVLEGELNEARTMAFTMAGQFN